MGNIDAVAQNMLNGKYNEALAMVDELLQAGVDKSILLPMKVSALIELERTNEARIAAAEMSEIMPYDAYAQFLCLRVRFLAGERNLTTDITEVIKRAQNMTDAVKEKLYNLLGQCCRFLGDGAGAATAYHEAVRFADTETLKAAEYSNYLFNLHYCTGKLPNELKDAAVRYGKIWQNVPKFFHGPRRHKKLRIGYISPDIREHVVLKFSYAFFHDYDHENFEVYCYQNGIEDDYSQRIKELIDGWRNVAGLSAEDTARLIYEDGIDILFDLAGHTKNNSLPVLAYKPAPVQLSGIGYFASTGLGTVDYVLSDRYLADKKNIQDNEIFSAVADDFSERLLVLPESHFCYVPFREIQMLGESPCERNGYVTFCSFNNFTKVNDEVLTVWKIIMDKLPTAHLLLKAEIFDDAEGGEITKERLAALGFDMSRTECRGFTREYMEEYSEADIALDTFPYPGGGTTLDALYMGVPVLTLSGRSQGERFGVSIMSNLGLEEFICDSAAEYVARAELFACDMNLIVQLRRNLRQILKTSPLMDSKRYMKNIETAYRFIWKKYSEGMTAPSGRSVSPLLNQAKALFAAGDFSQAQAMADVLLMVKNLDTYALKTLAEIYIDAKNAKGAKETVSRLLDKRGSDSYVLFLAARAAMLAGDNKKAEIYVKSALGKNTLQGDQLGLAHDLLGRIYKESGRARLAVAEYRSACEAMESLAGKCGAYDNYLLALHFTEADGATVKKAAEEYGTFFTDIKRFTHEKRKHHEKIRIGYVSADFCRHVMTNFMRGFFHDYDKLQFEVYGYMAGITDDMTAEFVNACDKWQDISLLSDEEAAELIYNDDIDILIDLSGHTAGNRLGIFAYKPVPVQVSGIGYMSTTGLEAIDYFIGDVFLDDNGADFTEEIIRLPHSHFLYQPKNVPEHTVPAPFLKNGYITFGSFNNFTKVTDEMLGLWAEIMRKVPDSRLYLKAAALSDPNTKAAIFDRMDFNGIDLDRIDAEGLSDDYFTAYNKVDIALDTYPYPGGGTTCDALIMGVPVITRSGARHGTRFGVSLLNNAGLEELCASSAAEYVEKAVALAEDKDRLSELHLVIRRKFQQSPVMDKVVYMEDLETTYREIWQKWSGKSVPATCYALAERYYKAGDSLRMISYAKKAVDSEKKWMDKAALYYGIGWGYHKLSRHMEAYKNFVQSIYCLTQAKNAGEPYEIPLECAINNALAHVGNSIGIVEASKGFFNVAQLENEMKVKCSNYSSYLLALHMRDELTSEEMMEEHKKYQRFVEKIKPFSIRKYHHKKIRIGYLSGDFRQHVMYYFYYALLKFYNREDFSVYCYYVGNKYDGFTQTIIDSADNWRKADEMTYEELADQIHEDEIDILVDLAGHTADNALPVFAYHPATVQISGIGYMDTTGLTAMDWFIGDKSSMPEGAEKYFTEKLIRLRSMFCYLGRSDVPDTAEAPVKRNGYITFGVFNRFSKYSSEMLMVWKKILNRVPESRLLLKSQVFYDAKTVDRLFEQMNAMCFPMERIDFEVATDNYMKRYLDVDIALDTYPYPGGGTTCDALFMGVPVIVRYGQRFGSRFGLSVLTAAGLQELAVDSTDAYVEKAVALAKDEELLNALHLNLRQMVMDSPLMDVKGYMTELENIYHELVEC